MSGDQLTISWHEPTHTFWANKPNWQELMETIGYTMGEVSFDQDFDVFTVKEAMESNDWHRITRAELGEFLERLSDDDFALLEDIIAESKG